MRLAQLRPPDIHDRLADAELFMQAATLEANDQTILVARPVDIAVPKVWVPESQPSLGLGRVREKLAELSKAKEGTRAKVETSGFPLSQDCDVKIGKAIITVESSPVELRLCTVTGDLDMGCTSRHG